MVTESHEGAVEQDAPTNNSTTSPQGDGDPRDASATDAAETEQRVDSGGEE